MTAQKLSRLFPVRHMDSPVAASLNEIMRPSSTMYDVSSNIAEIVVATSSVEGIYAWESTGRQVYCRQV